MLWFFIFLNLFGGEGKGNLESKSFGLEMKIQQEVYTNDSDWAFLMDYTLMPTLHFNYENVELAPYALIRYEGEIDSNSIQESDPDIEEELQRFSLGGGMGMYWHFVDSPYFSVLTGLKGELKVEFPEYGASSPTGYYNYSPGSGSLIGSIEIPFALEIGPSDKFKVRIWLSLIKFGASFEESYYRDDNTERELILSSSSPFWSNDSQAVSLSLIFPLK